MKDELEKLFEAPVEKPESEEFRPALKPSLVEDYLLKEVDEDMHQSLIEKIEEMSVNQMMSRRQIVKKLRKEDDIADELGIRLYEEAMMMIHIDENALDPETEKSLRLARIRNDYQRALGQDDITAIQKLRTEYAEARGIVAPKNLNINMSHNHSLSTSQQELRTMIEEIGGEGIITPEMLLGEVVDAEFEESENDPKALPEKSDVDDDGTES